MYSAAKGVLACSKSLSGGGDHNITNNAGSTVLHRSAGNGHVMMCKFWVVTKGKLMSMLKTMTEILHCTLRVFQICLQR